VIPEGEHTVGLNAIIRHVKAALRHLERDPSHDPDSCTDAIYRTNQAYEGSLKEAYRVLAAMDPSGLSPFQIEQYLETHNAVRPRVLDQLIRYRHDYRNPSAHDYKLDFDEDEALLAILSVCGFACLLVNQISSRLASNQALKDAAPSIFPLPDEPLSTLGEAISRICLSYTIASVDVAWFEYDRGIVEILRSSGFDVRKVEAEDESLWDAIVSRGNSEFGIETRVGSLHRSDKEVQSLSYIPRLMKKENNVGGLLILRHSYDTEYNIYRGLINKNPFYLIAAEDEPAIVAIGEKVAEFRMLKSGK